MPGGLRGKGGPKSGVPRPQPASSTPHLFTLAFLMHSGPFTRHKSLTQGDLAWPNHEHPPPQQSRDKDSLLWPWPVLDSSPRQDQPSQISAWLPAT